MTCGRPARRARPPAPRPPSRRAAVAARLRARIAVALAWAAVAGLACTATQPAPGPPASPADAAQADGTFLFAPPPTEVGDEPIAAAESSGPEVATPDDSHTQPTDRAAPQPAGAREGEPALPPSTGTAAPATRPPPQAEADRGHVNMEFRDTDLPTVLRTLCEQAGAAFVLDPEVKGTVTAKLRNTSWEQALDIILRSQALEATRQGDTLLISRASQGPAEDAQAGRARVAACGEGKLDLDASAADIQQALRELATVAGLNIVASKDLSGKVTASLHGLGAEEILLALADSCGASVAERGQILHVAPRPLGPVVAGGAATAAAAEAPPAVEVKRLPDGRLDIHATQAGVRRVVAELAAAAGLNVVTSEQLDGAISLDLRGVAPGDALQVVSKQAGLTLRPVGNVLFAAPAPPVVQSEIFRLRYADAKETGDVITQSVEGAKVAVETANNLLIVTGMPSVVATARQIVERVEKAPVQVTIETRIIETNLTGDEHLGIRWSTSLGVDATTPEIPHTWPLKSSSVNQYIPGYDPASTRSRGANAVPFADPDIFKFGFLTSTGLSSVLHFLDTRSNTRLLANPTVTTVDNRQARVNIVTKYPIAQYQVSSETGLLTVSGFEYKEFGTILEVTPRVTDGQILLDVHPEISRQSGVTQFQGADLPVIHSQETRTQVLVKDGDTLVIAGLIREETQNRRDRVPGLSRIPFIGGLFRSRQKKVDQRRHMLIFITPHIVGDADFARAARLRTQHTEPLPKAEGHAR